MPFTSLTASNTMADGVAVLLNADDEMARALSRKPPTGPLRRSTDGTTCCWRRRPTTKNRPSTWPSIRTSICPAPNRCLRTKGWTDGRWLCSSVTDDPDGDGGRRHAEAFVKLAHTDMFPSAPATGSTTVLLGSLVTRPGTTSRGWSSPGPGETCPAHSSAQRVLARSQRMESRSGLCLTMRAKRS